MRHELDTRARRLAASLLELQRAPPPAPAAARVPAGAGREEAEAPFDYPRTVRFVKSYEGLLQIAAASARALAEKNLAEIGQQGGTTGDEDGDALVRTLLDVHRILLEHPVAAKAAYSALAAEGRRYAQTSKGAALRERLRRSHTIQRAALLWRSVTMGLLSDDDKAPLPSTYLDNLLRAAGREDLEKLLGRLHLVGAR